MAIHKQAIKRHRQSEKRHAKNKHVKSSVRSRVKKVLEKVETKSYEASVAALREAQSLLSDAGRKKIMHPRAASRKISRLAAKVNALRSQ